MISIIICSHNKILRNQISINIEQTIGLDYEILITDNSLNEVGICKAYNDCAIQAKYEYLVFCHEDILFHTPNWGILLINHFSNTNARIVGFLGCVIKTRTPSSAYIYNSDLNRHNQLQRYPNGNSIHCYENPLNEKISEVSVVDGFFMATKKEYWQNTKFSEDYLKGFHAYDIDFSLKNYQLGKIIVVYDILIEHFSFGNFTSSWVDAQLSLTKKWNLYLPFYINSTIYQVRIAEINNIKELLKILIANNGSKKLIIIYYLKLLHLSPINNLNMFLIRKIILGNRLDNKIKSLITRRK